MSGVVSPKTVLDLEDNPKQNFTASVKTHPPSASVYHPVLFVVLRTEHGCPSIQRSVQCLLLPSLQWKVVIFKIS